jgi:hypothetical protein
MSWRHIRVVFIPKPGRPLSQVKSLRPISLAFFILKTLEKLIDKHIRDGVMAEKPIHQNQYACRANMSTEIALFKVVQRLQKSLSYKENTLRVFLDTEGATDNTSFNAVITPTESLNLKTPVVCGSGLCLKADWHTHAIWAAT